MNFLSSTYVDGFYRCYTDVDPKFLVCTLGLDVEDAESLSTQLRSTFRRGIVSSTDRIPSSKATEQDLEFSPTHLLSSDWCYNTQTACFSCIVITVRLSSVAPGATSSEIAEDLYTRLGDFGKSMSCKIIFCPVFEIKRNSEETLRNGIVKGLESFCSQRLSGVVDVILEGSSWTNVDSLKQLVSSACMEFHQSEIIRLREEREKASQAVEHQNGLPRIFFQLGWNYLILSDYTNARRQMLSGLRKLRSIFPLFPSFQARLCGSVFLLQFLSCVSLSGGRITYNSEVYRTIRRFVEWISLAYGASVSAECQTLIYVLTKFLEVDWLEFLVRKTENIGGKRSCNFLIAAAQSLLDCTALLPAHQETMPVSSPRYIGAEENEGNRAALLWRRLDRLAVRSKILSLMEEATSFAPYRGAEVTYLKFLAFNAVSGDNNSSAALLSDSIWQTSSPILSNLSELVSSALGHWDSIDAVTAAYFLLNGCVCPVNIEEQKRCRDRLGEICCRLSSSDVLVYPKGNLLAPYTIVAWFDVKGPKTVGEDACVRLSVFSTSSEVVEVTITSVSFKLRGEGKGTDSIFTVAPRRVACVGRGASQNLDFVVPLSAAGTLSCAELEATVKVGVAVLPTKWVLAEGHGTSACFSNDVKETISAPFSCSSLQVLNPPSIFCVSSPSHIQAVEGECIDYTICISAGELPLCLGHLTFPHEPKLFRIACKDADVIFITNADANSEWRVALPDVSCNGDASIHLQVFCLRSSEFRFPMKYQYSTTRYGDVDYTKSLHVSIDPPFDVDHFLCGSAQWCDGERSLSFATSTPLYAQHERNVLVKATDVFTTLLAANWKDDCALYFVMKKGKTEPFDFHLGDTITLSMTLRCTSKNGVSIVEWGAMCGDDVTVLSCCGCENAVALEQGECVTIVTRLTAKCTGQIKPGFLRVFFFPGESSACLFSDIVIPTINVKAVTVNLSTEFPLTVALGSLFSLKVTLRNNTTAPFIGKLLLDSRLENFTFCGPSRKTVQILPQGMEVVSFDLSPLRIGELTLPSLQVQCSATQQIVASSRESFVVHVSPADYGEM